MTPGDIVRCIDARYSEGRLVEGRMYVVSEIETAMANDRTPYIVHTGLMVKVYGVNNREPTRPERRVFWKSSRFTPVNRKDLETEILAKVADKMMGGAK